jgi:hypothetical protein
VTERLRVVWPDRSLFESPRRERYRILAVADEQDRSLDSRTTRDQVAPVDLIVGCGDLEPDYLGFLADAFGAPLRYVRGNHDLGQAWTLAAGDEHRVPEALPEGRIVDENGLRLLGFHGAPIYAPHRLGVSALGMWRRALAGWLRASGRRPVLVLTHAPPRGLNDAPDPAHRGFAALRWLAARLRPPLWLHGHTRLLSRDPKARSRRFGPTLLYNCTGAVVVDLVPPADGRRRAQEGAAASVVQSGAARGREDA